MPFKITRHFHSDYRSIKETLKKVGSEPGCENGTNMKDMGLPNKIHNAQFNVNFR
jgi:hypothetical protein